MSIQNEIDRIAGAKTTLGNYLQQNGVAVPQSATLDSMALLLADVIEKQNKITASGILKGDGEGGVSAAIPGTDYLTEAPVTSVNGKTGDVVLAKGDVGLGNVRNEAQYSAQNPPPYPVTSVNGKTGAVSLTKSDVGLGSVDNVSINTRLNRTNAVNVANSNYTTYMARGEALFSAETTPTVNGTIAWQYE